MTDEGALPGPEDMPGALAGVRVLEFSQIVAASFTGVNLSDLGADVVKVEPPGGEAYRGSGAVVPNEGKRFMSLNRGKRGLVVDLAHPDGRALIHRIVPQFDVVAINYRPGVAERLGIDYETLRALHPGLIYARITGFGTRGPMGDKGATDLVAGGYSGLIAGDQQLSEEGAPRQMTPAVSDYTTGLAVAMGICAALYHRQQTGVGQLVDGSLLQSALSIQDFYVMREPVHDASNRDPMLEEVKRLRAEGVPYAEQLRARARHRWLGAGPPRLYYTGYLVKDGAIVLGCLTKPTRAGARRVLGMEHDRSDSPDFDARDPVHQEEAERWREEIKAKMRERTMAEWMEAFAAHGVPAAPVHIPEEMSDDPQVEAMGMMVDLEHEVTGPQRVVGPIVAMSETPTRARRAAPPLGAHTREVLAELGLDDGEIAALEGAGVLG